MHVESGGLDNKFGIMDEATKLLRGNFPKELALDIINDPDGKFGE